MNDFPRSKSEKQIARAVFDHAVETKLAESIVDFKRRAAAVNSSSETWEIGDELKQIRRDFDFKYDCRYSQLIMGFGRLLREKWIHEKELQGLAEDRLEQVRKIATFFESDTLDAATAENLDN